MPGTVGEGEASLADQISIEKGQLPQLPDVRALAQACPEAPHWPLDAWRHFVEPFSSAGNRRSVLLLARALGGELVGWLAASGIYETAELEFVLVHPAHRGRGIAGRLIAEWLRWAEGEGALEAWLEVRPSNAAAIRLYREFGFAERGRRRAYYESPAEDALLMWRPVRGVSGSDVDEAKGPFVRQV